MRGCVGSAPSARGARSMRERSALVVIALALALGGSAGAQDASLPVIRILDARNVALDPARDALRVTLRIPDDATLPRAFAWGAESGDARDVRIEIVDRDASGDAIEATIESVDALGTTRDARAHVVLRRAPEGGTTFRSPFLRLVSTALDAEAPGVGDRLLRVALGDRVRVTYGAHASADHPVGRPSSEEGDDAVRRARLRVRLVRSEPGGAPPIGRDDLEALALAREQVALASEVWAPCAIAFDDPTEVDLAIVDPPAVSSVIAIADVDGLPAAGGGTIRLRAGGRRVRPVRTRPGARPVDTARALAAALARLGLDARVAENERAESGADRSADVVVRTHGGAPVAITSDGAAPLSTDARQRVELAAVELEDGLSEFDNMTALTGTLEERALIHAIADDDPRTIDVIVVPEFAGGTRDGEAFLAARSAGARAAIRGVVVLSREAFARAGLALTLPHELGHVLLDLPLHPDHLGPDRPWMLMDSDAEDGTILGPRRLTELECARARERGATLFAR